MTNIGLVVIGRNEGERLRRCLKSLGQKYPLVYVDSGSSDGSIELARDIGAEVVELNMTIPFTAARARNEGFARLRELYPNLTYVQFVDGDCEVVEGWLDAAFNYLSTHPDVAVVFGHRQERYPNASIYNFMCDMEWYIPPGETKTCGGDAMMRVDTFKSVEGYRSTLIAGEEPELCLRLREQGWKIVCLNHRMTIHDVAMKHFSQWWKRGIRSGHAFAEVYWLHRHSTEQYWLKHNISILFWGLILPLSILLCGFVRPFLLSLYLIYPFQILRIAINQKLSLAFFWVLVKFPQALGQLKYIYNRLARKNSTLIEYK